MFLKIPSHKPSKIATVMNEHIFFINKTYCWLAPDSGDDEKSRLNSKKILTASGLKICARVRPTPSPLPPPPIKLLHAARRNNMSHYAVQRSLRLIAREGRRIRRGGSIAVIETTPLAARLQPVCLCSVNSDRCIKPSVLTSTRSVPPGKRKRSAVLLDASTKKKYEH